MPDYRRAFQPGGTFFFTVVTHSRRRFLCTDLARGILRKAITDEQLSNPFKLDAIVLLPDHLHTIWTLPEEQTDFAARWARIKLAFTKGWLAAGGDEAPVSESRAARHDRGVWQPRYWEHTVRDDAELFAFHDYIHYNPVKHGVAKCPHAWPYSSFHRQVTLGHYERDWQCACVSRKIPPPAFESIRQLAIE